MCRYSYLDSLKRLRLNPVTTYADTMCCRLYWLGCAAGKVYSSKAAVVRQYWGKSYVQGNIPSRMLWKGHSHGH